MILYRTGWGNELIKEIEVEKHTENTVWLKNSYDEELRRNAKHSNYDDFWDTLEEAKKHLEDKFNRKINYAKEVISDAETKLKELEKY